MRFGEPAHVLEHLRLALGRGNLERAALEARRIAHAERSGGDQRHDLGIEGIDARAQRTERLGLRVVARIAEATHRRAIGAGFSGGFWHGGDSKRAADAADLHKS